MSLSYKSVLQALQIYLKCSCGEQNYEIMPSPRSTHAKLLQFFLYRAEAWNPIFRCINTVLNQNGHCVMVYWSLCSKDMPLHNFEPGTHSNAVSVRHSIDFPQSLNLPNETSYLSSKRKTFDLKSRLKIEVRLKKMKSIM